jgi:hypothetical protein
MVVIVVEGGVPARETNTAAATTAAPTANNMIRFHMGASSAAGRSGATGMATAGPDLTVGWRTPWSWVSLSKNGQRKKSQGHRAE